MRYRLALVACLVTPAALASACAFDPLPPPGPPDDPAHAAAALVSNTNDELLDTKRECANAAFNCAPLVAGGSDCACAVPQTGTTLPGFEEVDIAVRQFLAYRGVGAATVAIRYKDRLVYKRGFGRTASDWDDPSSPLVPPDSPMKIGSVSKNVGAAVARALVDEKLQITGAKYFYPTAGDVPLLIDFDAATPGCGPNGADCLLPEALHALFDGRADVPAVFDDLDLDPADVAAGDYLCQRYAANRADAAWADVTLGDVLGHSAGLPRSVPGEELIYAAIPAFRGYTDRADFEAEHGSLAAQHPGWAGNLLATRNIVANALGVPPGDVFYLNRYDALADGDTSDEILKAVAGRCLAAAPAGNTDSAPNAGPDTGYSNTIGSFVERIINHLHPSQRFTAPSGFPSLHAGSALEDFLAARLGITRGVASREGMFAGQSQASHDDVAGWGLNLVVPRVWEAGSWYGAASYSRKRPFCVFDDATNTCRFSSWTGHGETLRSPWDFSVDGASVARVPYWKSGWDLNAASGGLLSEMPLLVYFADRYAFDGSIHKGRPLGDCPGCPNQMGHTGSMGGARAEVARYGTAKSYTAMMLPPRDAHGRLTDAISDLLFEPASFSVPGGVTFAWAINQREDPTCDAMNAAADPDGDLVLDGGAPVATCTIYRRFGDLVRYALSRVDWAAVDAALAAQPLQIQGLAMVDTDDAAYLMADDGVWVRAGSPADHRDAPAGVRVLAELPSTRVGAHVVGAAYDDNRVLWTFYDDGRVSLAHKPHVAFGLDGFALGGGATGSDAVVALDGLHHPVSFAIAPDKLLRDVRDVAMTYTPNGLVAVAYYRDGTYSVGTPLDLAAHSLGAYTLPPNQLPADLVGVAMVDGDASRVWARYRDGSVSHGTLADLDAEGYWPGRIEDIAMRASGDTALVYRSRFVRWIDGTLADNWPLDTALTTIGWDWLTLAAAVAPGASPIGVGINTNEVYVLASDGTLSRRSLTQAGAQPFAHAPLSQVSTPAMVDPKPLDALVGFAGSVMSVYSWWEDGVVTRGNAASLDLAESAPYTTAPWQSPATVRAVARHPVDGGLFWALYEDGSVSAGTATHLSRALYKKKGPVLVPK